MIDEEKVGRRDRNRFELEGYVGIINNIYTNPRGKLSLRFDLGQQDDKNTQFVPIVIKGDLVESYGSEIKKGDHLTIKGRIVSYLKEVTIDNDSHKERVIEILGFEIEDKNKNITYKHDGSIVESTKELSVEMEK